MWSLCVTNSVLADLVGLLKTSHGDLEYRISKYFAMISSYFEDADAAWELDFGFSKVQQAADVNLTSRPCIPDI